MLEKEGGAQAAGLHLGIEVHMVLVQEPLGAGNDLEEVGRQPDGMAGRACLGAHAQHAHKTWSVSARVPTVPARVNGER